MPRSGEVGREVYEAVMQLTEAGTTRQEAFDQVAVQRGSKPGSVAANFYREARKHTESANGNRRSNRKPSASRTAPLPSNVRLSTGAQLAACIQQMVNEAVDARFQRLLD